MLCKMVCIKEVRQGKGQFLGKDDSHLQELSIYDLGIKKTVGLPIYIQQSWVRDYTAATT